MAKFDENEDKTLGKGMEEKERARKLAREKKKRKVSNNNKTEGKNMEFGKWGSARKDWTT